jgi:UDP-2,3-diacylglucosamine hydrolase
MDTPMPHTLIISDLHLSPRHERITELFLRFLRDTAPQADALYVLGDLFDYWAGDDDLDEPLHRQTADALRALSGGGVPVFLMHGNRDFLMAEKFAAACGATLLDDPALLDFYGTPTLLTHGDALCTDDTGYQAYRQQVRNPVWQQQFLSQPLAQRKAQIEALRARSESEKRYKSDEIMDVNSDAVAALLRQHGYPRLIHGHTHRPGLTLHEVDGHTCERWVLGDWNDACGNALHCEGGKCWAVKLT